MKGCVNQTEIGEDARYPERFVLADVYTFWDTEAWHYNPATPTHPDCDFRAVQQRLAEAGVEVISEHDLTRMARMDTDNAVYNYGEEVRRLRHPLGRTGINGTGVFHKAGPSRTADVVALRKHPEDGVQVALAHARGKWVLPGGFMEEEDGQDPVVAGLRELNEEISLDFRDPGTEGVEIELLIAEEIKPYTRKSADMGWLVNDVTGLLLPDYKLGDPIAIGTVDPNEIIESVGWFTEPALDHLDIGVDHRRYIGVAIDQLVPAEL